jgi:hypothetical protein
MRLACVLPKFLPLLADKKAVSILSIARPMRYLLIDLFQPRERKK